jgi:hypothetical protein
MSLDANGISALMVASGKGHVGCIRLLLQHCPGSQVAMVGGQG